MQIIFVKFLDCYKCRQHKRLMGSSTYSFKYFIQVLDFSSLFYFYRKTKSQFLLNDSFFTSP